MTFATFYVALTVMCYLCWAYNVFAGTISYPVTSLTNLQNLFDLSPYRIMFMGISTAAIGLAVFLLRPGVYAIYAMIIWAIGQLIPVVSDIMLAVPNTIGALIPQVANPNPAAFPINPILVAITVFVAWAGWWYLLGFVVQRDL
jgi:hypothetical protein